MINLTLLTIPPSLNATYRRGPNSFYKSREATVAFETMQWEAKAQYRGKPIKGPVQVKIEFWWPRGRHDIDNCLKTVLDALADIVLEDDSQIQDLHVKKGVDKENPRIEIVIESMV